ncbi:hypothetical protein MVEN_00615400 [Mycena venus]|uniref:Uncharacterized protein n=1 Tax=Mycena venus TaxID=2733690 RepID=A0A8H6YQT7_9AGAR|nr:hypothetical protein MVEN_00615400 [Mycena venus]
MDPGLQYNFPPNPQFYWVPPGHVGPTYQHPTYPPDDATYMPGPDSAIVQPTPHASRTPSPSKKRASKTPSPKKRGRGRPPLGNKKTTAQANAVGRPAAKAAAKAVKTKSKGSHRKQNKKEQENEPNKDTTSIETFDSDSEIDDGGRTQWSTTEKTSFFKWLLGPESDYRFDQHKKNPKHVYKRASEELFHNERTMKAVRSLYQRSLATFGYILAFESFTGNGGGDPDSDDPTAILKHKLEGARKAGLPIGTLKAEVIETWEQNGWRDLFNERLGANAKVSRPVVRNSASALSDADEDDDDQSYGNIDPLLLDEDRKTSPAPRTPASRKPAAIVSEPKFTPASRFRTQTSNSLGNMAEFMKIKIASEEKKAKAMEDKLDLDKAKLELEKKRVEIDTQKGKVEMAHTVLEMEGATPEVKNAANAYLLTLFQ